jgi:hypothetical protein
VRRSRLRVDDHAVAQALQPFDDDRLAGRYEAANAPRRFQGLADERARIFRADHHHFDHQGDKEPGSNPE